MIKSINTNAGTMAHELLLQAEVVFHIVETLIFLTRLCTLYISSLLS